MFRRLKNLEKRVEMLTQTLQMICDNVAADTKLFYELKNDLEKYGELSEHKKLIYDNLYARNLIKMYRPKYKLSFFFPYEYNNWTMYKFNVVRDRYIRHQI